MQNSKIIGAPTITLDSTNANTKAYSRLISGVKTLGLLFRLRATITLAGGPATALRRAGSAFGLIDQIGLEDNGRDVANMSGLMLRFLSQMVSAQHLTATRITSYANGATALEETAFLPFAWPQSVSPIETAFVERDPRNALQAFAVWNNTGTKLVATGGTAVLSAVTLTVQQVLDPDMGRQPVFIPEYRVISQPITASVINNPIYLKTNQFLRGLVIQQDTDIGEVDDIITSLTIRDDSRDYVGPNPVLFEDLARAQELQFGGNMHAFGFDGSAAATQPNLNAYLGVNFQEAGRLSRALNPEAGQNLRLEVTGLPSVTGGAATSSIRTLLMELTRWPGRTTPTIPFAA